MWPRALPRKATSPCAWFTQRWAGWDHWFVRAVGEPATAMKMPASAAAADIGPIEVAKPVGPSPTVGRGLYQRRVSRSCRLCSIVLVGAAQFMYPQQNDLS